MKQNEKGAGTTAVEPVEPAEPAKKGLHPIFEGDPWNHMKLIQRMFAKNSTDPEFLVWARRCKELGINPLKGESYLVIHSPNSETKRQAVTIDTIALWNRLLRAVPGFEGIKAHAVYENDIFFMTSEMDFPKHEWDVTADRGELMGAYAVIKIKGNDPFYGYYRFGEFKKTGPEAFMWNKDGMPENMIVKVAKMNAARNVCADLGNSYDAAEFPFKSGVIIEAEARPSFPVPPAPTPIEAEKPQVKRKRRTGPPPAKETINEMPQPPAAPANGKGLFVEGAPAVDSDLHVAAVQQYDEIRDILGEGAAAWLGSVGFTDPDSISTWDQLDEIRARWMERVD